MIGGQHVTHREQARGAGRREPSGRRECAVRKHATITGLVHQRDLLEGGIKDNLVRSGHRPDANTGNRDRST